MLKRFSFFAVEDAAALPGLPSRVSDVGGGRSGFVVVGTGDGQMHALDSRLRVAASARAHDRSLQLLRCLHSRAVVVTLGDGPGSRDGAESEASEISTLDTNVKLWSIETQQGLSEPEIARISLLRVFNLGAVLARERNRPRWALSDASRQSGFRWPHATALEVTEDLQQMAIGFSDGDVLLIRSDPFLPSDILQEKGHLYSTLSYDGDQSNVHVTGLGFGWAVKDLWLWVATSANLRAYHTNVSAGAPQGARRAFSTRNRLADVVPGPLLDSEGCRPRCCCIVKPPLAAPTIAPQPSFSTFLMERAVGKSSQVVESWSEEQHGRERRKQFFAIAKQDRIEYFSPEDPGSVFAVMGEKTHLYWFRNYLVVVTKGRPEISVRNSVQEERPDVIQLYDFRNKLIAMSLPLVGEDVGRVHSICRQWNKLLVMTTTRKVFALKEKDTKTKLDDLFRRNLYATAVSLAHSSGCDKSLIMNIYRMFGDHLYSKGSYDDAVAQYCRTLGYVEPSYVIQRFLDSQRIENLTQYLETLHTHPAVTPSGDHTTLLLNCYTKQKDESKLRKFVANKEITRNIDVQAAVSVLRTARYFEQALELAKEHGEHALCLEILIGELVEFDKALDYITHLKVREANLHLQNYGKSLMRHKPGETSALLESLCCKTSEWGGRGEEENQVEAPRAEDFIHIFVDHGDHLERFLKSVVQRNESRLTEPTIWNTYLELVLRRTDPENEANDQHRKDAETEAMAILKKPKAHYDAHHALVLVQSVDFKRGQLYLYEKLGMYHMLIKHFMEVGDNGAILTSCKTYGAKDANLWVQVLMYFAQQQDDADADNDLKEILKQIERHQILPPLVVIEILSSNPNVKLSMIRPYVKSQLELSQKQIDDFSKEVDHLRHDTDAMKEEIHQLATKPKVFKNTKCNWTGAPLELPTVHFLSGNSYNLGSLPGGGAAAVDAAAAATSQSNGPAPHNKALEDPECIAEQLSVANIMQKLHQNADTVDEEFFNQLEISQDGFSTVAEYFSKCLFDKPNPMRLATNAQHFKTNKNNEIRQKAEPADERSDETTAWADSGPGHERIPRKASVEIDSISSRNPFFT